MNIKVLGRPDAAPGAHADVRVPLVMIRRPAALAPLPDQLGALGLGQDSASEPLLAALDGTQACADTWLSAGEQQHGSTGLLRWSHNTDWLYGSLQIDAAPGELAAQVKRGYTDLFAGLRATGFIHPVRLWNYVPRINAEEDGLERYRHFNAGRQQAFLAAGQAAFEGSPAACALGTHGGPLCVRVLASRHPVRPIENPRQVSAYHYPTHYGPRSPSFSRAALVDAGNGQLMLLISGTASIVGHASLHVGDLAAQVRETLTNLQAVIDEAQRHASACFALRELSFTVYVRHREQAESVRAQLAIELGADAPAVAGMVLLHADICRQDLLVEIEAHAQAAGAVTA
jgi:chorismate lyase / 3-hydroxybenzoate synthase